MWDQPIFSNMSFSISNFQLCCALDGPLLKLTVSSLPGHHPKQVTLSNMATQDSTLELFFAQLQPATHANSHLEFNTNSKSSKTQEACTMAIEEKVARLQHTVRQLENRLMSHSQSKKTLPKNPSHEGKFPTSNSRKSLSMQQGQGLRQNQAVQYGYIIEREVNENAKLELLNGLLQQKILDKEGLIADLERQLMDREELIRELAEKLITANMEKQEIFNEYEKILQSTVFHRYEDVTPRPFKQRSSFSKHEPEEQIEERPEIDTEVVPQQSNEPLFPHPQKQEVPYQLNEPLFPHPLEQKQEQPKPQEHKN